MNKKIIFKLSVAVVAGICIPADAMAEGAKAFGGEGFNTQANEISGFLFGPAMRLAGVMGGAYGLIQSIMSASVRPLLAFGGIGLGANLIPKFIDGVFTVSGVLIENIIL
jgi:hypothetical protein